MYVFGSTLGVHTLPIGHCVTFQRGLRSKALLFPLTSRPMHSFLGWQIRGVKIWKWYVFSVARLCRNPISSSVIKKQIPSSSKRGPKRPLQHLSYWLPRHPPTHSLPSLNYFNDQKDVEVYDLPCILPCGRPPRYLRGPFIHVPSLPTPIGAPECVCFLINVHIFMLLQRAHTNIIFYPSP